MFVDFDITRILDDFVFLECSKLQSAFKKPNTLRMYSTILIGVCTQSVII